MFLLVPYALMFCYSFWSVSSAQTSSIRGISHNYKELLEKPVYWQTLLRSMWIAASVMLFSLLLGYPLAYFLSFYAGKRKDLLYQLVIIPLWVSYLVRALRVENDSRFRRRAQHAAAIRAPDQRTHSTFCSTVRSLSC